MFFICVSNTFQFKLLIEFCLLQNIKYNYVYVLKFDGFQYIEIFKVEYIIIRNVYEMFSLQCFVILIYIRESNLFSHINLFAFEFLRWKLFEKSLKFVNLTVYFILCIYLDTSKQHFVYIERCCLPTMYLKFG